MGAAGGIQYIVLRPGADWSRFRELMSVVPIDTKGVDWGNYDAFEAPPGEVFECMYADTYPCFYFESDLKKRAKKHRRQFRGFSTIPDGTLG